jgi:hypothetical protein
MIITQLIFRNCEVCGAQLKGPIRGTLYPGTSIRLPNFYACSDYFRTSCRCVSFHEFSFLMCYFVVTRSLSISFSQNFLKNRHWSIPTKILFDLFIINIVVPFYFVISFRVKLLSCARRKDMTIKNETESTPTKKSRSQDFDFEGYTYKYNRDSKDGKVKYFTCSNKTKQVNKVKVGLLSFIFILYVYCLFVCLFI